MKFPSVLQRQAQIKQTLFGHSSPFCSNFYSKLWRPAAKQFCSKKICNWHTSQNDMLWMLLGHPATKWDLRLPPSYTCSWIGNATLSRTDQIAGTELRNHYVAFQRVRGSLTLDAFAIAPPHSRTQHRSSTSLVHMHQWEGFGVCFFDRIRL